ncbi:MAG: Membrane-associated zinc metalloprotease [Parcubacteria group bacterium GW2011_GWB1_45_7]|nr:MAG: Membrane-associated zinc metalloprotease [Parcubacteria group bacterium GW2011_GWB1_45_7]OGY58622.1 MAG: hypothetical protein A3C03_02530 [Candidatus Colwellbacteria bacterium RIFCSPHIGHO2_02_FULL_45_17]
MEVALIGILFLIILVIGHEFGHFFAAKLFGLRVDEFGFGFPPRIFSRKRGETRYSVNLLPFGGFVKIHGEHPKDGEKLEEPERSFTHQSTYRRSVIIVAGAFMNFLIGWIALCLVFAIGVENRVVIDRVMPGSPASAIGLMSGQEIEGFNSAEEFVNFVENNKGKEVSINGTVVTPRENPPAGEGALGVVVTDVGIEKQGIFKSIWSGLTSAILTTGLIAKSFAGFIGGIFSGNFTVVDQVTGPVGVFNLLGDVSALGFTPLVQLLALISLNLVVINLVPFPALDGGRLLSIVVEKIIGRRLSEKFEIFANAIGLAVLLLLMVVVTIKDIINIF